MFAHVLQKGSTQVVWMGKWVNVVASGRSRSVSILRTSPGIVKCPAVSSSVPARSSSCLFSLWYRLHIVCKSCKNQGQSAPSSIRRQVVTWSASPCGIPAVSGCREQTVEKGLILVWW